MKTIGILGGMSAASTQLYYSELCKLTQERLGGLHSPQLLIRSLDFAEIEVLQANSSWTVAGEILNREAKALQSGGAEFIILATNTMHMLASEMMKDVDIPLLNIADATAQAILAAGLQSPGLMATAFTMEQSFYTDSLVKAGLKPVVPNKADRMEIHQIIYDELCKGIITTESQQKYIEISRRILEAEADCIILGCTEIGMLLNSENTPLPTFDTTKIHCLAALEHALSP